MVYSHPRCVDFVSASIHDRRAARASLQRAETLREEVLTTLAGELAPAPQRWGLVPAPLHGNVGDSAILLGTLAVLTELGWPAPTVISDKETFNPSEVSSRISAGPILLMGGGNFGDLYPAEHAVHLAVFREIRDSPVLQLPQTVYFGTSEAVAASADAIAERSGMPFFVRDGSSLNQVRQHLPACRPILCPDAAFGLGPLRRPMPSVDVVRLLRRDDESSRDYRNDERAGRAVDWLTDGPSRSIEAERWLRGLGRRRPKTRRLTNRIRTRLHVVTARDRMSRGMALLGRGRVVITDRLHGHILCVMMGIPHALVEDRNGKVASFVRQWTDDLPFVRLCATLDEAEAEAESLLWETRT